jgi:hypothetical protein
MIVGLAVVGLVAILGAGALMQSVHRQDGWPLGRFAGLPQVAAVGLHVLLALAAVGMGLNYCWKGVRTWRGDLQGGWVAAVFDAVVAAGAFFSAIELVSAIS